MCYVIHIKMYEYYIEKHAQANQLHDSFVLFTVSERERDLWDVRLSYA